MLARIRKAMEEREEGFTLIELLVVIIIIGILAAIAIPVFLNQRKKGYDAQAKSDLRNFASAEETYFTDAQRYGLMTEVNTAASPVKLSKNTTIKLYLTSDPATTSPQTWCAESSNSGGSGAKYVYESDNGGMQPSATTSCPAAYAFATAGSLTG
jgi:type IV pilus assembly protein PilA